MSSVSLQIILSTPRRDYILVVWLWSVSFGRFDLGISYCSACNMCQETVLLNCAFQSVWNYSVLDAKTARRPQPIEALLFFHGADFDTANLMEWKCPRVQSFPAHCFFISQLYERPHIAVTTKKHSSIWSDPVEYWFIYCKRPFNVFCYWEYEWQWWLRKFVQP